jgi:predicted RNA-binding Zn ribbon-like protein
VASDRDDSRLAAPGDLELVRDFVNTLDVLPGTEEIEDPVDLASWLAEHRLVPTPSALTDEDLARARSLREALRTFLLANAGFPLALEAAEAFDDAVGSARFRARADEAGRIELLPADADGLDHAIGRLVSIVFAAQQDGTWPRLKACAECGWALYDRTKNLSAAWCGSQCGARVRSRRYRERRRGSPARKS